MFTGIIQATASIIAAEKRGGNQHVSIARPRGWKLVEGQSIAVDGICSTVAAFDTHSFSVEYMPETLAKTTARSFKRGARVHLERSLRFGDPIDGHFVLGHVDARGLVRSLSKQPRGVILSLSLPASLRRFAVPKGSLSVNGVSLTIAAVMGGGVELALIPHTLAHTNLGTLRRGDNVNLEVDSLARYGASSGGMQTGLKGAKVRSNATKKHQASKRKARC